jgi:hypothetical protein
LIAGSAQGIGQAPERVAQVVWRADRGEVVGQLVGHDGKPRPIAPSGQGGLDAGEQLARPDEIRLERNEIRAPAWPWRAWRHSRAGLAGPAFAGAGRWPIGAGLAGLGVALRGMGGATRA